MDINKVVVIGSGTMGLGIAQVFAQNGKTVVVRDINDEIISAAQAKLNKSLDKLVAKGKMEQAKKDAIVGAMTFTTDMNMAADADLVVEAATENPIIKKGIFTDLDGICKAETILASNTSSLSITEIGSATKRPEKVIGMHFFNPANRMKLIEVIRGEKTSDETYDTIFSLSQAMGKDPVTVAEAPGFVVNRILIPMINEACEIVQSGIASPADVDKAMKLGANHPMGPLELGDFIGLDVCLAIMNTLYSETGDSKYRPSLLLKKMVRAGKLGNKTGVGFFDHTQK